MARLDRLVTAKAIAQYAAVLGRQFSYALLHAVSQVDEGLLQQELGRLVEAEIVYQRGAPPQSTYVFKHALIQDVAYQSLLKSTRQQYHQRIAQVLAEQFPETAETQPELLAHHYTEAGLIEQAIPYWQRAGQHASDRSANVEAISHFTTGIELLKTLPETPGAYPGRLGAVHWPRHSLVDDQRARQRPRWSTPTLRPTSCVSKWARRPSLPKSCMACGGFIIHADSCTRRESSEKPSYAWRNAPTTLHSRCSPIMPSGQRGSTLARCGCRPGGGSPAPGGKHRRLHARPAPSSDIPPRPWVSCHFYVAWTLWLLGYPEQALARVQEALALAHALVASL